MVQAPVKSLPSRPLRRDEVERFEDFSAIDRVYPVYREMKHDESAAAVIVSDGTGYAIAYQSGEWVDVEQVEFERDTKGGVHIDEHEKIEQLQRHAGDRASL